MWPPPPAAAPQGTAVQALQAVADPHVLQGLLTPLQPMPAAADAWMRAVPALQTAFSAVLLQGLPRSWHQCLPEIQHLTSPACLLTPLKPASSPSISTAPSQSASNRAAACL